MRQVSDCPLAPEHDPTNRWRLAWLVARLRDMDGLSIHAISPCFNKQSSKPVRLIGFPSKRCRRLRCWGDTPGCAARDRSRVMKRRQVSLIERNVNSVSQESRLSIRSVQDSHRGISSTRLAAAQTKRLGQYLYGGAVSDFREVGALDVNAPSKVRHRRRWNITGTPECKSLRGTCLESRPWPKEAVRKHYVGLQSFRSMRRMDARRKKAEALRFRFSPSLANLRQRFSQAMVRSTIQRRGSTIKLLP